MRSLSIILACLLPVSAFCYSEDNLVSRIDKLVTSTSPNSAVVVVDLNKSKIIYKNKANAPVKPASVLKLLTSQVALSTLGPHYRFSTKFYSRNPVPVDGAISALYVKGGGDPSFTLESMIDAVREIKKKGVHSIGQIVLDESYFNGSNGRSGQRAYEAGSSALSFNFNSISFDVCPSAVGQPARVVHDPYELPLKVVDKINTIKKGRVNFRLDEVTGSDNALTYRVSGELGRYAKCLKVYRSVGNPPLYFGMSLLGLLEENGIKVLGGLSKGLTPANSNLLYDHSSKVLSQIVWDLNNFSTNFIAEQLLFSIGSTHDKVLDRNYGLSKLKQHIVNLGFEADKIALFDGCGLSHSNRITAMMLAMVLREARLRIASWPEYKASLSVAGKSGTLKKRLTQLSGATVRAKTGSLNNVSSLAGYIDTDRGNNFAFVIISNQVQSIGRTRKFEEDLVKLIVTQQ
ncbi:MAG: D-alanyl-D-alanine carboxypeptidase/D-alanyl-D-alanine-endopeptidase [Deltaproteobacteria bacterium]|nr:D-alanyl-D-alanine carboxypeptidase/D-alanyl-D-alanine-endopeptidase [Deltaproteobacteria bacterium]